MVTNKWSCRLQNSCNRLKKETKIGDILNYKYIRAVRCQIDFDERLFSIDDLQNTVV
jgi:hypothetical protein